ncbi:PDF receptor-like [Brachionus plicatilis]|uniref:PDF receptor-like n=1 Tax=Brachionus plicatilis TaxID=10195 RepID=A0A3M7SJM0_BRAPC|nr:PDF receptor-like [Brachionus plicatilis]
MMFQTSEECHSYLESIDKLVYKGNATGCPGVFDKIMCWPAVAASTLINIPCPNFDGLFDETKNLTKKCLESGVWDGINRTNQPHGYTNYEVCLTQDSLRQSKEILGNPGNQQILRIIDHIEIVGLVLSFFCICFSLFIFGYHKNLRCKRTKIHLNLFITIFIQSIVRIVSYIDRFSFRILNPELIAYESQLMLYSKAICPLMITILEYIQMCNFMWMLNEGAYLNILLTYSVFDDNKKGIMIAYYVIGWGFPGIMVTIWSGILLKIVGINDICWSGFYNWKTYWIIKTPIIIAITINIICLINVIRILASKLRENRTSEIDQIKKSLKAAILLLPLFGITHIFEVYEFQPQNWYLNLIFSIIKAILVFYQGVFLSILYCFMNNEVKNTIRRNWLNKIKFKSKCFEGGRNRRKKGANGRMTTEGDNLLDMQMTEITKTAYTMSKTEDICI